jgi:hypothetical protein
MITQFTIDRSSKLMYGIMLVNKAGETVASAGWDYLKGDVTMFGGFVSAIQIFIRNISGGNEVEELRFGDMKLLIGSSEEYHVVTLHEADESEALNENREVLKLINENGNSPLSDGHLGLIKELVSKDQAASEKVGESVKDWTKSVERAKKSASDWGKTVF